MPYISIFVPSSTLSWINASILSVVKYLLGAQDLHDIDLVQYQTAHQARRRSPQLEYEHLHAEV